MGEESYVISRFSGPEGRRHLIDALQGQQLLRGCPELAERIANIATVESFDKGSYLIREGHGDNDMFLLLSGRVSIVINGRPLRQRAAGTHVGEMSLIERASSRSRVVLPSSRRRRPGCESRNLPP